MNYKPEQNPQAVNNRIQNYIDTVMHPGCTKHWRKKDQWTVEKMVSWERFGSTICNECFENRERLHMMVQGFKTDYDAQCRLIINRATTPYSELPYSIRGKISSLGISDAGLTTINMDTIYEIGKLTYTQKYEEIANTPVEKTYWKIDQIIANWNINLLTQRVADLENEVSELKYNITPDRITPIPSFL